REALPAVDPLPRRERATLRHRQHERPGALEVEHVARTNIAFREAHRLTVPPQCAGPIERRARGTMRRIHGIQSERDVVEPADIRCEGSSTIEQEPLRIATDRAVPSVQTRAAPIDRLATERDLTAQAEQTAAAAPV